MDNRAIHLWRGSVLQGSVELPALQSNHQVLSPPNKEAHQTEIPLSESYDSIATRGDA